jgi:hypothetical protein
MLGDLRKCGQEGRRWALGLNFLFGGRPCAGTAMTGGLQLSKTLEIMNCPYRAVNTLRLGYKNQSVNAV